MASLIVASLAAIAVVELFGCATVKPPLGRIESVVVNDRYVSSPRDVNVRIIRKNAVVSPSISLRLQPGDSITTSNTTRLVLEFVAAGYRVTLDTSTSLVIESATSGTALHDSGELDATPSALRQMSRVSFDPRAGMTRERRTGRAGPTGPTGPAVFLAADSSKKVSIWVRIGRAFIEHIKGPPGNLQTNTPGARLDDDGTKFQVSVSASKRTTVSVTEGAVRCASLTSRDPWSSVIVKAGQAGDYTDVTPPRSARPLRAQEAQEITRWVRDVERVTKIPVPRLDSLSESEARATAERAGLRVLLVRHAATGRAAPDRVVDQTPSAGDSVPPGTFMTLVLERAQPCTVPKITGERRSVADELLRRANLTGEGTFIGTNEGVPLRSRVIADSITFQSPPMGKSVSCGSVVKYTWVQRP